MARCGVEQGVMAGVDRRLLAAAVALGLLTGLAVLDRHRPVPGSEPPLDWWLPAVKVPETVPMTGRSAWRPDDLLGAD